MPRRAQEIEGFGGMCLRFVRLEPDELVMETTYSGDAGMPPRHLHPSQSERFQVIEGPCG